MAAREDDPPDAGSPGGLEDGVGGRDVAREDVLEARFARDAGEVDHDVYVLHGRLGRGPVVEIGRADLFPRPGRPLWRDARPAQHAVVAFEAGPKRPPYVPGGSRDQDVLRHALAMRSGSISTPRPGPCGRLM